MRDQGSYLLAIDSPTLPDERVRKIEAKLNEEGVMRSLYVPPEKWSETRSAEELRWERKVQLQAQREGNALRQNDILSNELGKG